MRKTTLLAFLLVPCFLLSCGGGAETTASDSGKAGGGGNGGGGGGGGNKPTDPIVLDSLQGVWTTSVCQPISARIGGRMRLAIYGDFARMETITYDIVQGACSGVREKSVKVGQFRLSHYNDANKTFSGSFDNRAVSIQVSDRQLKFTLTSFGRMDLGAQNRPTLFPYKPILSEKCPNLSGNWKSSQRGMSLVQHECRALFFLSDGVVEEIIPDQIWWFSPPKDRARSYFQGSTLIIERKTSPRPKVDFFEKHQVTLQACGQKWDTPHYVIEYFENLSSEASECEVFAKVES